MHLMRCINSLPVFDGMRSIQIVTTQRTYAGNSCGQCLSSPSESIALIVRQEKKWNRKLSSSDCPPC